jgi:hypothetical protein
VIRWLSSCSTLICFADAISITPTYTSDICPECFRGFPGVWKRDGRRCANYEYENREPSTPLQGLGACVRPQTRVRSNLAVTDHVRSKVYSSIGSTAPSAKIFCQGISRKRSEEGQKYPAGRVSIRPAPAMGIQHICRAAADTHSQ